MTLFGLTLAVGLLVDDAIVVVENVERLLHENPGMTPREATIHRWARSRSRWSRSRWSLSAVFLPMAFFGGSTGVIYKQFSLTIVSAMVLSVLVALILSPALTSTLLRQRARRRADAPAGSIGAPRRSARSSAARSDWFNTRLRARWSSATATSIVAVIDRKWLSLGDLRAGLSLS